MKRIFKFLTKPKKEVKQTKPIELPKRQFNEVALDLETLALEETSVILSIGLVPFNMDSYNDLLHTLNLEREEDLQVISSVIFTHIRELPTSRYYKLDILDQFEKGRIASKSTLDFWKKQALINSEAASVLDRSASDITLEDSLTDILEHLTTYVEPMNYHGSGRIVCRGYDFDCGKLESALGMYEGKKAPWNHSRRRCSRSLIDAYFDTTKGFSGLTKPVNMVAHSALDDAAWDATQLIMGRGLR